VSRVPDHRSASREADIDQPPQRRSPGWPATTLLGRLRPPTRDRLLVLGTTVSYPDNDVILKHGERGDNVVLLLSKAVKVVVHSEHGPTALLAIRIRGDLVGEQSVIDHNPRSASVIACGDVLARSIGRGEFEAFLRRAPDAELELRRMVSERLRWADQRRVDFLALKAYARVARVLVEVAKTCGWTDEETWELDIPLTQEELGSLASIARRTVEQQMKRLIDAGLVRTAYRRTSLLDMAELQRVANSH